jgi:hypothetical protein
MGWLAHSPLMHVLAHAVYPIKGLPGFAQYWRCPKCDYAAQKFHL